MVVWSFLYSVREVIILSILWVFVSWIWFVLSNGFLCKVMVLFLNLMFFDMLDNL